MALETAWYDLVCYGIIGMALLGALWVLEMNEGASRRDFETTFASLLLSRPEDEVVVSVLHRGHVSTPQLWTSCWRGLHPFCLLVTRFLSFVIMLLFLLWDVLAYDASIFFYYTEWTIILVTIYFALGTIVSAHGCWRCFNKPLIHNGAKAEFLRRDVEETMSTNLIASNKLESQYVEEDFQQRAGFWGFIMQTIYQTCAGAAILTDIVFWVWGVIVPFLQNPHLRLSPLTGCMHALNAFFLLLDTSLNNLPQALFYNISCKQMLLFPNRWPYPFLELNNKWAPIWYLCLAVIHAPCYGVYYLIVRAKNTILPRLFPQAFLS
ncbi:uncharacterized protein [Glycine max]|uniref:Protein rolling stone n=1 Tax=Glycine soja TaxID=3848 RepID=A0A445FJY2_GLYSO|nr:uncharacterized protein LOC100779894 isoform X2 [Glycine max]RZB49152.1 hypothetical protein D0Y65_052232 [Glycine soja]